MILQEMNGNGHWKRLPTATVLVLAGEVATAAQDLVIQPLAAIMVARLIATMSSVLEEHFISNVEKLKL